MDPEFKSLMKWGAAGILGLGALALLGSLVGTAFSVASAPGRVVSKTLETNNIIHSYEWFHDVNAQYESRLGQLRAHAKLVAAEKSDAERSRLGIELSAMRQSCRDLVTRYNANSVKVNKSIFKGNTLPETLEIATCEA